MKKIILTILFITSHSILVQAQEAMKLDLKKSEVKWFGGFAFDFGGHEGTVNIKSGELIKVEGKIARGTFVIDMNTIVNTDGDLHKELIDHLKSDDFFDVENHPTAKLSIEKVKYHDPNNTKFSDSIFIRLNGELTIKDITHPVMFEGEVNAESTMIIAKFKIDRTRWNVNFKSKSIGARLKDGIISDAIELRIALHLK